MLNSSNTEMNTEKVNGFSFITEKDEGWNIDLQLNKYSTIIGLINLTGNIHESRKQLRLTSIYCGFTQSLIGNIIPHGDYIFNVQFIAIPLS